MMNSNRTIRVSQDNKTIDFQYDDQLTWAQLHSQISQKSGKNCTVILYFKNMRLQGFKYYTMRILLSMFSQLYIIVNPHQFKDMAIQARLAIRSDLCCKNRTTAVPIMIEYHFNNQFMSEKYVLSNDSRVSVITSMCGRHVPHCCVAVENLFVSLRRFNPTDRVEVMLPYLEEDGFLHIYASDTYRYDFEDYLLPKLEYYDSTVYKRVTIKGEYGKQNSMLLKKNVTMKQLEIFIRDSYNFDVVPEDQTYPLISDMDEFEVEIVLVEKKRKISQIEPTLQYTIAIGYKEPYLYLLRKSSILIVYDIKEGYVQTHQALPVRESLTPYQERLPSMLENSFLMSEILKSGVSVLEFSLKGKLIREIKYPWDPKYVYQLACLDYMTVKISPQQTRNQIWRVHQPDNRLIFQSDKDSKLFISKVGHGYNSHLDLIAVYTPKNLNICIYKFSTKQLKYRLKTGNFLNWISFSLCGQYIMYSNDFSPIEQCELKSGAITAKPRLYNAALHFYDQHKRVMAVKDGRLWIEGVRTGIPVDMSIAVAGTVLCRVSDSDHMSRVLFL